MRATLLVTALLLMGLEGFSQQKESIKPKDTERARFQDNIANQVLTLTVNLSTISKNDQGRLKDELLSYKEKVSSLSLDEATQVLVVTHTGHFKKEDVLVLLNKYGIKASTITSYK